MTNRSDQDTAISWSSMQEALAQVPALVAVTRGPEHQLVYTNDSYLRAFGARESDGPAPRVLDGTLSAPLDDVFTSGRPYSRPAVPGGRFTFGYAPLRDHSGAVTGVLVIGGDVSLPKPPAESKSNGADPGRSDSDRSGRRVFADSPYQPDELQVAARYLPGATETDAGGDWYDVIALGAGRTALVIGDVMGRGTHAAEVMGQLRSALRAYARLDLPPAEILSLLDALVSELHPVQMATCLYATFDPVESLLSYSTAGHPPPLLRHPDGRVQRLTAQPGAPLGVLGGPYPVQHVLMPPGSILLLYTDGLVERRDEDFEIGIAALAEAIRGSQRSLEELADTVLQRLGPDRMPAGSAQPDTGKDDIALLLARSAPATTAGSLERSMRLQLNSGEEPARRARAYTSGVLSAWQLPQTLREDIVVVVGELVANAVLHSGLAQELRLRRTSHRVVLEVLDRSPRAPKPRPADPEAESGRGMYLVAQLADRWGVRPLDGGKSVWCEFIA